MTFRIRHWGWVLGIVVLIGCPKSNTPEPAPVPEPGPSPIEDSATPDVVKTDVAEDTSPSPANEEEACLTCHKGIENAHPKLQLTCTDCHGGNAKATTKEEAHVTLSVPSEDIRQMATDKLDELPEDELLFVNPGDLRVANRGCGSSNPASGGTGCHQTIVDTARTSVMQTFTGHYNHPRFLAGMQGRAAEFGVTSIKDTDYDPAVENCVEELEPLRTPTDSIDRSSTASIMDHYLPQHCPSCHTASFGKNNSPGNYRSSGCSACHMLYTTKGVSTSGDPTRSNFPPHADKHVLTTAIPTEQCQHCHYQGARIGLTYQGIREGGFKDTPPNAKAYEQTLHGHGPGFYILDEDTTNNYDETPPDIHFERGMHCGDCHTSREVHGDGHLYSTAKGQLDIHCVDCHGSVRENITEMARNKDGAFKTQHGTVLKNLRVENGQVLLKGRVSGKDHPVTQIKDRLAMYGPDSNMNRAMGVDPETGFSHTDKVECWTCHTSWRLSCFGCHVTQNDKAPGRDLQTGDIVKGRVIGERQWYAIDLFIMGTNKRGMIDSLCPSMQMFMNYTNEKGEQLVKNRPRYSKSGQIGFGWMPTNPHTIRPWNAPNKDSSPGAATCARCHVKEDGSNLEQVRAAYGFGAPWYGFKVTDDKGVEHDLTQMLNEDGTPISEYPHANTGPVSLEVIKRMLVPGSHLKKNDSK